MKPDINSFTRKAAHAVEVVISLIVLVAVIGGIPDILRYIVLYVKSTDSALSYAIFSEFIKHTLMLVVGLELVAMIINHQNESILTLVLYVIARKMLVYADNMTEILLGTLSIVLVFVVLKFFTVKSYKKSDKDGTISAGINFFDLKELYGIDLDTKQNTLGGLIYELSKREGKEIKEGEHFEFQGYDITIAEMRAGLIERVAIEKIKTK